MKGNLIDCCARNGDVLNKDSVGTVYVQIELQREVIQAKEDNIEIIIEIFNTKDQLIKELMSKILLLEEKIEFLTSNYQKSGKYRPEIRNVNNFPLKQIVIEPTGNLCQRTQEHFKNLKSFKFEPACSRKKFY